VLDHYRMGIRLGDTILLGIVDRALAHVAPERVAAIMERWYAVPVEPAFPWRLVLVGGGGMGVLIAFLLLHLHHRQRYARLLERENVNLEHLSATDPLTRMPNRRRLEARLEEELERARRHGRPLALIFLDLDRFKGINDTLGHQAGDRVLTALAELIRQRLRLSDIFGRWGGEEFLVICPETDGDSAAALAERVREAVAAHDFGNRVRLTISLGVAAREEGDVRYSIFRRVDVALYAAKAAGRNRVAVAPRAAPAGSGGG
jgi:polar amino acid transport system substrate-binding protein